VLSLWLFGRNSMATGEAIQQGQVI